MRRRRRRGVHADPAHGRRRGLRRRRGGAGCTWRGERRPSPRRRARADPSEPVRRLAREFRRQVDELAARDGLDRDELIVGLMPDGPPRRARRTLGHLHRHSHPRPMHLPRARLLVRGRARRWGQNVPPGAKLVAVGGVPIDDVVARVRPLITRDNEWSFRERVPYYVVCAEVLRARHRRVVHLRDAAGPRRRAGAGCGRPVRRRVPLLLAGHRRRGRSAAPALGPLPGNRRP